MHKSDQSLISRADQALSSPAMRPKAKALLLLNLCQVYSLFSTERAEQYFEQLTAVKSAIPADQKALFDNLQEALGESESSTKGLAGEINAATREHLKQPGVPEAEIRAVLGGFEEKLRKSFSPFGKRAAWEQLIRSWMIIDRPHALELSNKLNDYTRKNLVRSMDRQKPLSQGEWTILEKAAKQGKTADIILEILNDPRPVLNLPTNLVEAVFKALLDEFARPGPLVNRYNLLFSKTDKLIALIFSEDSRHVIVDALKIYFKYFPSGQAFEQDWPTRFRAVEKSIIIGTNYKLINESNADVFLKLLPPHMTTMAKTLLAALFTEETSARSKLADLLKTVDKKDEAETYYLVNLVFRGWGEIACSMAAESARAPDLLPRVRRAWIAQDAGAAAKVIGRSEVGGDTLAELLLCNSDAERVDCLREKTGAGTKSLPADLWVNTEVDEARIKKLNTLEDVAGEYTSRNPLYSTYSHNTPLREQFGESLRFSYFGEQNYTDTDKVLLGILFNWANERPEEVRSLLHIMWRDIKPGEDLLKIDFLRGSILNRCAFVFSVMPDFLVAHFLSWLNNTMVQRALTWSEGRTDYTLSLPETVLSSLCLTGALAISGYSAAHKDTLLEKAVTGYAIDDNLVEAAASLYNSDKEILDLTMPWKSKRDLTEAWQLGVVKNAIGPLFQAAAAEELQELKTGPVSDSTQVDISCAECGSENLPVARFCSECGSSLSKT